MFRVLHGKGRRKLRIINFFVFKTGGGVEWENVYFWQLSFI